MSKCLSGISDLPIQFHYSRCSFNTLLSEKLQGLFKPNNLLPANMRGHNVSFGLMLTFLLFIFTPYFTSVLLAQTCPGVTCTGGEMVFNPNEPAGYISPTTIMMTSNLGTASGDEWFVISTTGTVDYDLTDASGNIGELRLLCGSGTITIGYEGNDTGNDIDCCRTISVDIPTAECVCTDCNTVPNGGTGNCAYPGITDNPDIDPCTSLNIAFVIDESGSIAGDEDNVSAGVLAFLDAISCPNTQVAIIEFAATASLVTDYDDIENVADDMVGYFDGSGYGGSGTVTYSTGGLTNWHYAMSVVADLTTAPELVLFFTDGNPTYYGIDDRASCSTAANIRGPEIYNSMNISNTLKAGGTHLFMLGVGGGVNTTQLANMSGNDMYVPNTNSTIANSDYLSEPDFDALAMCLQTLGEELCPSSMCTASPSCPGEDDGSICISIDLSGEDITNIVDFEYTLNDGPLVQNVPASNGANGFCIEDLAPGTYDVDVWINLMQSGTNDLCTRPAGGCTVTITNLTCEITNPMPEVCSGSGDGTFMLAVIDGSPPYAYEVSNDLMPMVVLIDDVIAMDDTISVNSGLTAGTYTVSVSDNSGCETTCSVIITSGAGGPSLTCAHTDVICNDDNGLSDDGTITASGSGGTGTLAYVLTPGNTSNNTGLFTGLMSGSYVVTVTDDIGCSASCNATINPATALSCAITDPLDPSCNSASGTSNDGSLSVSGSGGTAPYSYTLGVPTKVGTTNTSGTFTGLSAGLQTVTVTDDNGCTSTCSVTLNSPTALSCMISDPVDPSCNSASGTSNDGSLSASGSGGTAPYSYTLVGTTNTSGTFTGLSAGLQTVTVTDDNGCTSTCSVTLNSPTALSCMISDPLDPSCNSASGTSNDGSLSVSGSGGTAPYSYTLGGTTNTSGAFTGLSAGLQTVTVTDDNGCTSTCSVTLNSPTALSCMISDPLDPSCNSASGTSNDGSLSVSGSGGTAPYSYTLGGTTNTSGAFTGLSAGLQTVTVTDDNGCTSTCSVTLNSPTALSCMISDPLDPSCNSSSGTSNDGSLSVSGSGGSAPYSYTLGGTTNTSGTFTGLSAGLQTVTVTDDNGCTSTCSVTLNSPTALSCMISDPLDPSCNSASGTSNDGSLSVSGSGGTAPYSYTLGDTTNTSGTFTGLSAGLQTVTVTDDNGCTSTCSVTLNSPTALSCMISDPVDPSCNSASGTSNDGSLSASGSGGAAPYSYTLGGTTNTSGTFTGLSAGLQTVTVTDDNGCTSTCSVTLNSPDPVSLSCEKTDVSCNDDEGSADDGTVTATVTGGFGILTYELSPLGLMNNTGSFTGLEAETYTVTVTDESECSASCTATIAPAAELSLSCMVADIACNDQNGSSNDGSISTNVSGGVGALNYTISPGGTTNTTGFFENLAEDTYTITVTDSNGCAASCMSTVSLPDAFTCFVLKNSDATCNGGDDGSATAMPAGETYLWDNGEITQTATSLAEGTHSVVVTTSDGCSSTCEVEIGEPEPLEFCPQVNCDNLQGVNAIVSLNITGGTTPYEVNIDNMGWRLVMNDTIHLVNGGTYSVDVRDLNQCTSQGCVPIIGSTGFNRVAAVLVEVLCCDIACPSDAEFDCGDLASIDQWLSSYTITGCVGTIVETSYDVEQFTGGCGETGSQVVIFNVKDVQDVVLASCMATLSIIDTIPPMITCPMDTLIDCATSISPDDLGMATATDQCDQMPTITFADVVTLGMCPQESIISRTWTATDDCQNMSTCLQTITVQDTVAPVIPKPGNIDTAYCGQIIDLVLPGGAIDNCDMEVFVETTVFTIDSLCPGTYKTVLQYDAIDDCLNSTTAYDTIQFLDTLAPMMVCPKDTVLDCVADTMPSNTGMAIATDLCSDPVNISYNDIVTIGECPQEFTIARTWTATDQCGNDTFCLQMITVQDTTAPIVIFCPADIIVDCGSLTDTMTLGSASYEDFCSGLVEVTFRDEIEGLDGTCINQVVGTITRTFFGEDECGNVDSSCVQIITIQDTTAPMITLVGDLIAGLESGSTVRYQCFGQDEDWALPPMGVDDVDAVDECDPEVDVVFTDVVELDGDCATDGFFRRFRCTWTATDECGNSSEAFILFEIVDTIAPTIVGVPEDIRVSCDAIPDTTAVQSFDECLCSHLTFEERLESDEACASNEVLLRIWTATDHCGNETIVTQRIELIDEIAPNIKLTDSNLSGMQDGSIVEFDCSEGSYPDWIYNLTASSASVSDVCSDDGEIQFEMREENGVCFDDGYFERMLLAWSSVDACGNKAELVVEARIVDNSAPVFLGYHDDLCTSDPESIDPVVYDECSSNYYLTYTDEVVGESDCGAEILRVYIASDDCGNEARDTIMIHQEDQTEPRVVDMTPFLRADDIRIECQSGIGDNISGLSVGDVIFDDNCSTDLDVTFTEEIVGENPCDSDGGIYVLLLTWTATDNCGNVTEFSVQADVFDVTEPTVNMSDTTYYECGDELPELIVSDNCGLVESDVVETIIPGRCAGEEIRTYQVMGLDFCGNDFMSEVVMIVEDKTGPRFQANRTVCDETYVPIRTALDECVGVDVAAELVSQESEQCEDMEIITRTYSATDACGNTTIFVQRHFTGRTPDLRVEILDPWLAEVLETTDRLQIDASSVWYRRIAQIDGREVFSPSECILEDITYDKDVELLDQCRADGVREIITFSWSVNSVCGSSEDIILTVEVKDDIHPEVSEPNDATIYCGTVPSVPTILVSDNYPGSINEAFTEKSEVTANGRIIYRTWTFTDLCGNATDVNQEITMIDHTGLSCVIVPAETVIDCNSHNNMFNGEVTGSEGPYTYEWTVTEGDCLITGGQGTPDILVYVGFLDIHLELVVTDVFGCSTVCTFDVDCEEKPEPINGTPIQGRSSYQSDDAPTLISWPNPIRDHVSLKIETKETRVGRVDIYDAIGRIVYSQKASTNERIDINTDWPDGLYILRYKEDGYELIEHFVKNSTTSVQP